MALKIEEIERLDAERTQGEWTNAKYGEPDFIIDLGDGGRIYDEGGHSVEDANFIAAAPTIAAQYIKARRFEVTDDMIKKAHTKQSGGWERIYFQGHDFKKDIGFARAILEIMWEEVEQ